ncbi:MAG: hypothetical protein KDI03_16300, partial [Anaerolineae bacterium]|nr:hypothetical protein [Anaerolineae bacterium]
PCEVPADIPWLSLDTTAGSNGGGTNTDVTVTFDSTGYGAGTYTGNLCVDSNDPDPGPGNGTDLVIVPVTMTVETGGDPNIFVNPLSMDSTQATNTMVDQTLTISNTGGGTLDWMIDEENTPAPLEMPAFVAGSHAASAGLAPNPAPASMPLAKPSILGSNAYSWNSQNGPYYTVFDIDVPGTLPNIAAFPAGGNFVGAGEYYNGMVYMMDGSNTMYEVNPATGVINNQYAVTAPPNGETYSGMAVDPTTGAVYASSTSVSTSSLFSIVPATGVATLIGAISNSPGNIAISFDGNGDLYGYDIVTDTMMAIDKSNGNTTDLGPLPFDANFGQGMGYDPATDTVYLAAFNNGTFLAELYTYDTGANTYAYMGVLGGTVPGGLNQLSWLGFDGGSAPGPCDVPSDIPWLSLSPANGSNGGGTATDVTVTFDSTGYGPGTYTGNLCVGSNDPDAGPGNETNLVIVPVSMTVEDTTILRVCSTPNVPIPDQGSVSDTINIPNNLNITDVNVYINALHTWVGDLSFVLDHAATPTTIIDRPGVPALGTFGCSGDNYNVTVDDEGPDTPIEDQCSAVPPAISGVAPGGDPPGPVLQAYDGQDANGPWVLTVTDNAGGDTGTLVEWCLEFPLPPTAVTLSDVSASPAAPLAGLPLATLPAAAAAALGAAFVWRRKRDQ